MDLHQARCMPADGCCANGTCELIEGDAARGTPRRSRHVCLLRAALSPPPPHSGSSDCSPASRPMSAPLEDVDARGSGHRRREGDLEDPTTMAALVSRRGGLEDAASWVEGDQVALRVAALWNRGWFGRRRDRLVQRIGPVRLWAEPPDDRAWTPYVTHDQVDLYISGAPIGDRAPEDGACIGNIAVAPCRGLHSPRAIARRDGAGRVRNEADDLRMTRGCDGRSAVGYGEAQLRWLAPRRCCCKCCIDDGHRVGTDCNADASAVVSPKSLLQAVCRRWRR